MAIQTLQIIKSWFRKGLYPTENQFSDTWDSFWHKSEDLIPMSRIDGLNDTLNTKAEAAVIAPIIERLDTLEDAMQEIELLADNTFLSIHAPVNSLNVVDSFSIAGVPINRNCHYITIAEKADTGNALTVEIIDNDGGDTEPVSLEQFAGKTVFVLASETEAGKGVDITLELIKNQ